MESRNRELAARKINHFHLNNETSVNMRVPAAVLSVGPNLTVGFINRGQSERIFVARIGSRVKHCRRRRSKVNNAEMKFDPFEAAVAVWHLSLTVEKR